MRTGEFKAIPADAHSPPKECSCLHMRNSAEGLWVNLRVKEREFVSGAKRRWSLDDENGER